MSFYEDLWLIREFEKGQKMEMAKIQRKRFVESRKRKQLTRQNKVRRVQRGR